MRAGSMRFRRSNSWSYSMDKERRGKGQSHRLFGGLKKQERDGPVYSSFSNQNRRSLSIQLTHGWNIYSLPPNWLVVSQELFKHKVPAPGVNCNVQIP